MYLPEYYRKKYKNLSDREIVNLIVQKDEVFNSHDENAATYLLWDRYDPALKGVFLNTIGDFYWYDFCIGKLFITLKGKDGEWYPLAEFKWKSTLGYWLKLCATRIFLDISPKLIENPENVVSIDDEDDAGRTKDILDPDVERNRRKVILMEAIRQLKDYDQKFVVVKKLQGYSGKEIAEMMQKMWDKHGIVRIIKGQRVIPSEGFVNNQMHDAKVELRKIIADIE